MKKAIDLSPYWGDGVSLDERQARWDALPERERRRLVWAIVRVFSKHAGIKLKPKNKKRTNVPF
jgi:hypothetical protein